MAVSNVGANYTSNMYYWQSQQLKQNTSSNVSSSSASSLASSLFNSNNSMVSQVSSMVELTKYAMDAMGVTGNSRVTFSQITRYREQLQNEFNQSVKSGLNQSGITDLSALTFSLGSDGKIAAIGANAADRQKAQDWLDANPAQGRELRKALTAAGIDETQGVTFSLLSNGKMTVIDTATKSMQTVLDANPALSTQLRDGLAGLEVDLSGSLEFEFSEAGNLVVKGDHPQAETINEWLASNPDLANKVKENLEKQNNHVSAASLRLGSDGNIQISVNSAVNNDIQAVLDGAMATGKTIYNNLDGLGIDSNIKFSIQLNDDGTVAIMSDHADKDKVQQFFDSHPELVKKYMQIEALSGIDDARKAMQISPSEMRKRIQIESLMSWWADSSSTDSYFGSYANGSLSMYSALNMTV